MRYAVVLDFAKESVFVVPVLSLPGEVGEPESERVERLLDEGYGFDLSNCHWMVTDNPTVLVLGIPDGKVDEGDDDDDGVSGWV